ncbi:MAG: penicillin-binding protein 1C [Treponema sp.]|nr:penicillin-binding protein 1C [Treponema sp.]
MGNSGGLGFGGPGQRVVLSAFFRLWRRPFPASAKKARRFLEFFALFLIALIFALSLPDPLFDPLYSPALYSREGRLLGAMTAPDGQWRFPPGKELNKKFTLALIEYEDRRFRLHPGVDPLALARSLLANIRAGKVVSGASTITMQTVRLMRRNRDRTLFEKCVEAFLALRLELAFSKDEILALYSAHAPFGGNVVGLEAASWRWFGRPPLELSWAEAATLAVLPNSPSRLHPGRNRELLKIKRDSLLERLKTRGFFDEETLNLARAEPLPETPLPLPAFAPHLLARAVRENRIQGTGAFTLPETTIDFSIQERSAAIMQRWAGRFAGNGVMNGAALILDTQSGEVLSYVGNVQSAEASDVDIVVSPRSSGSILKPFLYAAMLDSGDLLPAALISDIPTRVGSYSPENISRNYLGAVPADQALARSLNIPAVRSLRIYGVERFARLLRDLGITTLFRRAEDYGLPLILGGAETTLWDLAGLYSGLARTALWPANNAVQFFPPEVFSANKTGRTAAEKSILSAGAAWLTLEALTFASRPGEEAAWQEYASSRRIAWKTGTSFGFRDAWAIGVTPRWTVAVWIGNASGEGRPELRSALSSAPVLFELFSSLEGDRWFPRPDEYLKRLEVCGVSGYPAGPDCETVTAALVPKGAPPHSPCPYCKTITLNSEGTMRLALGAGDSGGVVQKKWFILPPAEEWYFRRWNLDYKSLPPLAGSLAQGGSSPGSEAALPLALFNPEQGAEIFVPVELDGTSGRVVFSAAHRDPNAALYWHLDESYLGFTELFHEMEARPAPGGHTLTLVDAQGHSLSRRFTVLDREGL